MGTVYEAEEIQSGRRVALKVLKQSPASPANRRRFLREGRLAASVNHPNSIYVFGTEEIEGQQVITMELAAGGTLQDRVKRQGPLPITEAVEAMLQVVAGLEAAAAVGVLHRDLKPSNCFVESDGTIKIGDFGLSIAPAANEESSITLAGSFLGTPAFSSPEQLRGDPLTIQSDIYAVGVTFYYLLTGKTPFAGDNLVRQLTLTLESPAETPAKWRPEIPKALCNIVLRCLEKEPSVRFGSYSELRQCLLPYSSTAPLSARLRYSATPPANALLHLRFLAAFIDWAILWAVLGLFYAVSASWNYYTAPQESLGFHTVSVIAFMVFTFVYFGVSEGLWGASLGKLISRVQVVNYRQSSPGLFRSCSRVLILMLFGLPISIMSSFQIRESPANASKWIVMTCLGISILAAPLLTVRRRNGLAAMHDLWTATRVVQKFVRDREQKQMHDLWAPGRVDPGFVARQPHLQLREEKPGPSKSVEKIGPYAVIKLLEKTKAEELLLAFDARVQRKVWIRRFASGVTPEPPGAVGPSRRSRLRWLTGKRTLDECWDAYEALNGTPFLELVREPQPWSTVRFWLLDLAEELTAYLGEPTTPLVLALDRVWITAEGRAKLLDFPAPGATAWKDAPTATAPGQTVRFSEQIDPEHFLGRFAVVALQGRVLDSGKILPRVSVPLPLHARKLLMALETGLPPHLVEGRLKSLLDLYSSVSRWRRLGVVAGCSLFLIWPLMLLFAVAIPARKAMPLALCLDAMARLTHAGGLDGQGFAYSATRLGLSLTWDGANFNLGPPNAPDAVRTIGQTILLPPESCARLRLLAAEVGARQADRSFTITYSDNTSSNYHQRLSFYCSPQDNPGEFRAVTMNYLNLSSGSKLSQKCWLYGYSFPLDPAKRLKSLTLPSTGDVVLLAATAGTPGSQVDLRAAFNVTNAIVTDGFVFPPNKRQRDAFEVYIAGEFRQAITNPATFNLPLSIWRVTIIPQDEEQLAKQALMAHPLVASSELSEATPIVQSCVAQAENRRAFTLAEWWASKTMLLTAGAFYFLVMTGLPALVAALFFDRGLILRLAGLSVVKRDGSPASRLRLVWRSFLVCLPALALLLSGSVLYSEVLVFSISIASILLALGYILLPGRSPIDRLAGTCLVPL